MIPKPDLDLVMSHLRGLNLKRLGDDADAGLVQVSLPHPPCPTLELTLGGASTGTLPLGQWEGEPEGSPRRVLLTADATSAPETLTVSEGTATPVGELPAAEMVLWKQSDEPGFMWQNHYLKVSRGDKQIGLAMGLLYQNQLHWWEACRLVVESETPEYRVVRMAGAIPVDKPSRERFSAYPQFSIPWLHKHNWLYGDVVMRLYANGVCEVMAHHINSMYVDIGGAFDNVVPVIGLVNPDGGELQDAVRATADDRSLMGSWAGDADRIRVHGVEMDIAEAARLATEEVPGSWEAATDDAGFVLWQPYQSSLFGGVNPMTKRGTPWHARPGEKLWPRGMARTVSWTLSLGDRSPRVARYLAPYAWYGLLCELTPQSRLPVSNALDSRLECAREWIRKAIVDRGFEDGSVPRGVGTPDPQTGRSEPGWDGDVPYAQFLLSYGSQREDDYRGALRSAYHQTDVATDHSMHLTRMHGYPDGEYAQPMHRPLGTLMGYFETGDPYMLQTAISVVDRAWHIHQGAWPRLTIGRDASFIRGAVFLYRMTGDLHYRDIARQACHHVAETQRENGSFGDQGGGAGIHQNSSYVTKPWMNCLGTSPVLDLLMLDPDQPTLSHCIKRLGDWLLAERWERDGVIGWSYQHDFMGLRNWPDIFGRDKDTLPTPGQWHDDQLGRILAYASQVTGNPAYLDAYFESMATKPTVGGGHGVASTGVHCLWLQTTLANVSLTPDGPSAAPLPHHTPSTGDTTPYTIA